MISIITILELLISPMKKYQLWLQRKSYSQHLINLIKIKTSVHTPQKFERKHQKMISSGSALKSRDNNDSYERRIRESSRLGDISYPVLNKELKQTKHQLMRSFEIQQENQNMLRRMKEVKSVINLHKHAPSLSTQFSRRKDYEKKHEQTNEELRESKFRKYIKWQSSTASSLHPFYLTIEIANLAKFIRIRDHFAGLWCEISTEKGTVRSEISQISHFGTYKYGFPLEHDLEDTITLKMFTCKGLDSEKIGDYSIPKPSSAHNELKWYRSTDGRFEVEMKVSYHKNIKSKALAFK